MLQLMGGGGGDCLNSISYENISLRSFHQLPLPSPPPGPQSPSARRTQFSTELIKTTATIWLLYTKLDCTEGSLKNVS